MIYFLSIGVMIVLTVAITPEPDDMGGYIGSKNSMKFHLPTYKNLPAEN